MGVIKRQSILGSIFLYIGVFIGFITSSILFPRILSEEQIGLLSTLLSYSLLFAQIGTLGFVSVTLRMFSYFRNPENKHNGYFFLTTVVIIAGFLLSLILLYFLKPAIISRNIENAPLFVEYINYLIPLIFAGIVFMILDMYNTVLFQAVRGLFLKEFLQRIFILIFLILYYYQLYSFKYFTALYVFANMLPAIILIIWLAIDGELVLKPKLNFITPELRNTMLNMSLFGMLYGIAGIAAIQADKIMITSMINLKATGIYTTGFVFAALIRVPSRAVLKISSAVIAEAWKRNDLNEIQKVYRSTAINQYIIGLLVFIGIWANIHNIFRLLPPAFEAGKYVIFFFGLVYTFDMAGGANNTIIANSKYYNRLIWFIVAYFILIIAANLLFIPLWGITGAAVASAISLGSFILARILFVYIKFGMQPFNIKFISLSIIGVLVYFVSSLIPVLDNLYLDIALRSTIITVLYGLLTVVFNISPDVNEIVAKYRKKYFDLN